MDHLGKRVGQSAINDHTVLIFPNDLNPHGTLFGGRVLEIADRLAAVVAMRHSGQVCVTLALDSVRFLGPATSDDILVLKAAVNCVWRTSMEVGLKAFAEDFRSLQRRHIFSAYFTYVALDTQHRPTPLPRVIPESDDERRRYEQAEERRAARLRRADAGEKK